MVHLTIHLISEAKLGGPDHYRWMYPVEQYFLFHAIKLCIYSFNLVNLLAIFLIERYLMRLKSYVRNKAQPEGSIAEGYIKEECLNFCSRYFEGVETPFNRPLRNDDNVVGK